MANKTVHDLHKQKVQEIVMVRGIAAALQAMHSPNISNLNSMLVQHGYQLTKLDQNQQTQSNDENTDSIS